mmetsp:Transcript_17668/g.30925  ORF Transcript_17668/g.30925 Transcript_17668/m.30925 type:complete len:160 (-) Transcript_17668:201-680(-)|eukprot:CAMPEP_0197656022 /NCGR_PEP_ID=MMETSP1338-20131121/39854_1 /TAXON_ID=43686 ORGANISM="Pelagodinium beii, Strain RCC1491" /NCGR_SAMPLE_ID=MMETSP1338 /ASSEMBLY_ACC=CAM_ASM_000754 /LENGTH=159 /DNA_ID=CAMNT_0043231809 /DNA_START=77 /DNA_END=556 /DNA_ORIENTATION=-
MATRSPRRRGSVKVLVPLLGAAMITLSRHPLLSASTPPPKYTLRVCQKCAGDRGYSPLPTLQKTGQGAAAAGWPAPEVELGQCTGNCDLGVTVRLVKGEYAIPVVVDGMTELEEESKAFLEVNCDGDAERAFGLCSRMIMEASGAGDDEDEVAAEELPA